MTGFSLDGRDVRAAPGETIWQVARREGIAIPHLCLRPQPGYRPDGNCRACMVEIEGERVLAPSCQRLPRAGMAVRSDSARAVAARRMVMELLLADQPARAAAPDPDSALWRWADAMGLAGSRFPGGHRWADDASHPAMAVRLDACIQCGLCVRACREVQVNDVIGMAYRGDHTRPVFDADDPMGESTCVGCGECVQACPTGALLPAVAGGRAERVAAGRAERVAAGRGERVAAGRGDRQVDSLCPYCGVGCQVTYHVQNDRIRHAEGRDGPANHGRLCVKGRFGFDYITHPHRLTVPLLRRDDAPKSAGCTVDPGNPFTHFRPAGWDEALARAAAGFRDIRAAHGPAGLAGFGSAKGSNEEAYLFQKLVRTGFGTNNVDHCTRLCHASSVAALMEGLQSGAVSAPFAAALEADLIFVIGANPTVNHPVAATFMKNAVQRGAQLILADPRGQALSRLATIDLRFRPGTDVALLNAMLHVIVTEGLVDRQFVQARTEGFSEFAERIMAFSPERMAPLCGVPAETLRAAARLYARARAAIIFWGMGISQHVHGTDNARCLIALALLTGQIGRPGTGLHPLRGQNNVQGASDAGLIPMFLPDYHPTGDAAYRTALEALWGAPIDPAPGLTVVEIMKAAARRDIRGMYILGENPAMSDPDLNHARAALASLDHLVVQDIFLTETAFHADVVLPASAFAEKSGSFTSTDRRIQLARPVVPLPGQARQDWWIVQELARRLGLDWTYAGPAEVFAEMAQAMPSLANITWERLEREGAVTYPVGGPDIPGRDILFADRFPTESGRARLVPADVEPPAEVPDDEYDMVLSTGRVLEHWHTGAMTRRAAALDAIEPEAVALLRPAELARRGLAPGGRVQVHTRRGSIEIAVRADPDVPEGMVFIPFCYAEAAANLLTNPQLDPFGKIPEFKFCAARVSAVQ